MVLEEAKILNKKIVITDTAAREAIADYKDSIILKNDEDMIYKGLKNLMINTDSFKNQSTITYNNDEKIDRIIELIEQENKNC